MDNKLSTAYNYQNPLTFNWTLTETTPGTFRQKVDWGNLDYQNRIGIYLVADPNNTANIRVFLNPRVSLPAISNPVVVSEPIMEEVDNNNRIRRLFFIGTGTTIYVEPSIYNGDGGTIVPQILYVFQVTGKIIKDFGL